MAVRTAKEWVSLEAATAADLNKPAGGWIGYAENAADQTGITGTVDITNATVSCTVGASRLLKISGQCHVTAVGGTATYYVTISYDGSTVGRVGRETLVPSGDVKLVSGFCYVAAPSSGSGKVAKLSITLAGGGASSLTVDGGAGARAQIIVEDCGSTT